LRRALGQIYGGTVVIGLSAACAGLVLCLWAGIEHVYSLLAASVLFVAGIGISVPSLITRVAGLAPAPVQGLAVALYTFVLFVGASIGPWLAQSTAHWSWAVTLSLLAALLGLPALYASTGRTAAVRHPCQESQNERLMRQSAICAAYKNHCTMAWPISSRGRNTCHRMPVIISTTNIIRP